MAQPGVMTTKSTTRRKPGLWFSPTRVEVQDVTARHVKLCSQCGTTPCFRRMMVTSGGGRHAQTSILCVHCGTAWLMQKSQEALRAVRYLEGKLDAGEGIRL